jgi:hypothetical protein
LPANRVCRSVFAPRRSECCLASNFRRNCFSILTALCLLAPHIAHSQDTGKAAKLPVESELIVEGEGCFGHYHIFANSWWSNLYTGGVEYDRHSWGYFLKSRMDYVAEALPVALLLEPANADVWGNPLTKARQLVPGVGISPIGLRMMWRSNKSIRPYYIIKGGMIVFDKKVLSPDAAYQNFLLQIGIGVQARLTSRLDLRMGYSDIHFSDAFIVPSNPGLDVMSYNAGLSYHLGQKHK